MLQTLNVKNKQLLKRDAYVLEGTHTMEKEVVFFLLHPNEI